MRFVYDNFRNKPFKPLYNALVPRRYRKRWDFIYNEIPTQRAVEQYWEMTINEYIKGNIEKPVIKINKPELVGKKIIWQYWAQGIENAPEFVNFCFKSVDRFKGDYTVIRLTDDTVKDYLIFPDFVKEKRKSKVFKPVFFSDLLRITLINNYGGIWLDASIFLTDALPQNLINQKFFMFSRDDNSPNKEWGLKTDNCYFGWSEQFKVNFLSSIIFGQPNTDISMILQDLMLNFWKTQDTIPHYFFFQILINTLRKNNVVNFEFPIIDDTLPHKLQFSLNEPFNSYIFEEIIDNVSLHKLSFHKQWEKIDESGIITYYGKLLEKYN